MPFMVYELKQKTPLHNKGVFLSIATMKNKLPACLLFFLFTGLASAQNLFDAQHSFKYGIYQYKNENYKLAAEEFERVLFLQPNNDSACFYLMKSNLKTGEYRCNIAIAEKRTMENHRIKNIYLKSLILDERYERAKHFIAQTQISDGVDTLFYSQIMLLRNRQYSVAAGQQMFLDRNTELYKICFDASCIGYKKPFVAAGLSAILPGSGKLYTGDYADGLYSFLFVALNAWQAHRGFSKRGLKSGYGWIFAGLSTGFYIGNIAGAAKAANKYNKQQDENIFKRTQTLLLTTD